MFHSATTSQRTHATTMSVDESSSASAFTSTSNQFFSQTPPAPPQRPFQQQRVPDLYSRGTQTDQDESSRQPSLDENTFAALLEGAQKMSPAERCEFYKVENKFFYIALSDFSFYQVQKSSKLAFKLEAMLTKCHK